MALHPIWGLYLPYFRLNVDQVPIPFINGAEATYDEVGATRLHYSVQINGLQSGLSKRQ